MDLNRSGSTSRQDEAPAGDPFRGFLDIFQERHGRVISVMERNSNGAASR